MTIALYEYINKANISYTHIHYTDTIPYTHLHIYNPSI